jgi:hypothetical protein
MPHTTRRLLKRRPHETEGSQDDEQVEITSLDHPDEPIDQRKRQFLTRTLQAATTLGTAALLPLAGQAYLQYQRAERLQAQLQAREHQRPDQSNRDEAAEINAIRQRDFERGLSTLRSAFEETEYYLPVLVLQSCFFTSYPILPTCSAAFTLPRVLSNGMREPRITTFKRVLEETQNYVDAAHAEKTEEWKELFARMIAYIGVSTPASFLREESSPLERVDEAYGDLRNLRPYSINNGGLFYPMRKQIREHFLVSLQSVFEQGSSPLAASLLAASKQWN